MVKAALTLIIAEDRPDVITSPEYEAAVMALHALAERFPEPKTCQTAETLKRDACAPQRAAKTFTPPGATGVITARGAAPIEIEHIKLPKADYFDQLNTIFMRELFQADAENALIEADTVHSSELGMLKYFKITYRIHLPNGAQK